MIRAAATLVAVIVGAVMLAACTEKPQTNSEGVKYDASPWSGTGKQTNNGTVFTASGWQVGDKAAWERQIKGRTNGQNEYNRVN